MYSIYKITNKINNKVYIGFSNNVARRWNEHIKGAVVNKYNYPLHKAIRKYGEFNFTIEVILESKDGKYLLEEMEPYFIKKYDSFGKNGYNLTEGGEGIIGYKWTAGQHESHTKRLTGKKQSSETIAKRIAKTTGQKRNDETKLKMSLAHRGDKNYMFGKTGRLCNKYGIPRDQITKNKISNNSKETYKIILDTGENIIFTGICKFCKDNGYTPVGIIRLTRGIIKHHKNIIFAEKIGELTL